MIDNLKEKHALKSNAIQKINLFRKKLHLPILTINQKLNENDTINYFEDKLEKIISLNKDIKEISKYKGDKLSTLSTDYNNYHYNLKNRVINNEREKSSQSKVMIKDPSFNNLVKSLDLIKKNRGDNMSKMVYNKNYKEFSIYFGKENTDKNNNENKQSKNVHKKTSTSNK